MGYSPPHLVPPVSLAGLGGPTLHGPLPAVVSRTFRLGTYNGKT